MRIRFGSAVIIIMFSLLGAAAFLNVDEETAYVSGAPSASQAYAMKSQPQNQAIESTSPMSSIGGGPDTSQVTSLI